MIKRSLISAFASYWHRLLLRVGELWEMELGPIGLLSDAMESAVHLMNRKRQAFTISGNINKEKVYHDCSLPASWRHHTFPASFVMSLAKLCSRWNLGKQAKVANQEPRTEKVSCSPRSATTRTWVLIKLVCENWMDYGIHNTHRWIVMALARMPVAW
jgi:hypothetical protein